MANPDIGTRFREAILRESEDTRKRWLFKRPKLALPNIREISLKDMQKGELREQFPTWYKLVQVHQENDWHDEDVMEHTLDVLAQVRKWYKKKSVYTLSHQLILEDHFGAKNWDKTHMQWFEWFIFFHDIGKLTTLKRWKKQTHFIGHEAAGGPLLEKWLTAVEIQPAAESYLKNMVTVHGMIHALLDDLELTHKGILIHAKRQFRPFELLELLVFTQADMDGSRLKKKNPTEYRRRKKILSKALLELLDEIENAVPD